MKELVDKHFWDCLTQKINTNKVRVAVDQPQ